MEIEIVRQIEECRRKLREFLQNVGEQNGHLKQYTDVIKSSSEKLVWNVLAGINEATLSSAEQRGTEIIAARNAVLTSLNTHWVQCTGFAGTNLQQPLVSEHIRNIRRLQQLYWKQNTLQLAPNFAKVDIAEIHQNVEYLLAQLALVQVYIPQITQASNMMLPHCSDIVVPESCQSLNYFSRLQSLVDPAIIAQLEQLRNKIISRLVLVPDKQPASVMMKAKKVDPKQKSRKVQPAANFTTKTQLSVYLLNIEGQLAKHFPRSQLKVHVALIAEPNAQEIEQNGLQNQFEIKTQICSQHADPIQTNPGNGQVIQASFVQQQDAANGFVVEIPDVMVLDPDREQKDAAGKKLKVFEEKLFFLFTVNLRPFFPVTAWALSLPTIVCTHTKQAPDALATISWRANFSDHSQILPQLRTTATLSEITQVLRVHFTEWTKGLELSDIQAKYLEKILVENLYQEPEGEDAITDQNISLANFFYGELRDKPYSLWTWCQAAAKLLNRAYIRELYQRGYFFGYISKSDAWELLGSASGKKEVGDFVLRVSHGALSEISAVFVTPGYGFGITCFDLNFSSTKTIKETFLKNIYGHLRSGEEAFKNIYPGTPKETVFPRDASKPENKPRDGYAKVSLTIDTEYSLR